LSDDLKVDSNDLFPLVEAPARPGAPNPLRVAGWSIGGAAVGVAIASGAVWLASLSPQHELSGMLDSNGRIVGDPVRARQLQQTLNAESGWTEGLLIGAGALAATSVVLLIVTKDAPPTTPQVSVGVTNRDVGVMFSGRF